MLLIYYKWAEGASTELFFFYHPLVNIINDCWHDFSQKWPTIINNPREILKVYFASIVLRSALYVIYFAAEKFDPTGPDLQWHGIPEMFNPRSNFATVILDDMIFVVGGFNGNYVRECAIWMTYSKSMEKWVGICGCCDLSPSCLAHVATCAGPPPSLPNDIPRSGHFALFFKVPLPYPTSNATMGRQKSGTTRPRWI